MNLTMVTYVPVFVEALAISLILTPVVRAVALRAGLVYMPNSRTVHRQPMPVLGGVAIFIAFVVTVLHRAGLGYDLLGLLAGLTVVFIVGIRDDIRDLAPLPKFLGQIVAAALAVYLGVRIEFVTNPFGPGMIYLGRWGIPLTFFWILAMTNVVNFLDGLDGLAAGVSSIASIALFVVAAARGQALAATLAIALAGSAVGFLPYNFNPAKIFMGDAGAMSLGFAIAVVSVEGALKGAATIALVIPMFTLGVPILDTAFAIARRVHNGTPFYQADREHLHHRLLAKGFSHRGAVVFIYLLSGVLASLAVMMARVRTVTTIYLACAIILGAFLAAIARRVPARTRTSTQAHHR
ncbi:MAG: MraY family glycosyltransferase [Bacillota bacterium]